MERTTSIIFIAFLMLAGHRASGQETDYVAGKGSKPQSVESPTPCQLLSNDEFNYLSNFKYQMAYDTLKKYIDTCYE